MTYTEAQAELHRLGITLRKRDGEYRINYIDGHERTAYYTDDLGDAIGTARLMYDCKHSPDDRFDEHFKKLHYALANR